MKELAYLLVAGVVPLLVCAQYRRLNRSPLAEEYYSECGDPCSCGVERLSRPQVAYYSRPTTRHHPHHMYECQAYDTPYGPSSLNYLRAPRHALGESVAYTSKGIGGSICGPLGTTVRGEIGCGGLAGSIVTPLGTSISGRIGRQLHLQAPEPCQPCSHDAYHYL